MLKKITLFFALLGLVSIGFGNSSLSSATCPDLRKVKPVIIDLGLLFEKEICDKKKERVQLTTFANQLLFRMMNKDFLGTEPPPNWQALTQDILANCDQNEDICSKEARKDIAVCISSKIPQILFILGPWFAENCDKVSKSVINDWKEKRKQVKLWLK